MNATWPNFRDRCCICAEGPIPVKLALLPAESEVRRSDQSRRGCGQVTTALGAILRASEAKALPCGVFGSFGWSGEAVDEMEARLRDAGFKFGFEPIRVKFKPTAGQLQVGTSDVYQNLQCLVHSTATIRRPFALCAPSPLEQTIHLVTWQHKLASTAAHRSLSAARAGMYSTAHFFKPLSSMNLGAAGV